MPPIPRYRAHTGPALFSAGFRPFFLLAALWAGLALPLWLAALHGAALPTRMPALVWHIHEMAFGYGGAVVAGFLLTAIPNWTGRLPLQGVPLATLAALWLLGRLAVTVAAGLPAPLVALLDLIFPAVFLAVVAREIIAGRNWRNLPMLAALASLLAGNLLVHLELLGIAETALLGNRLGVATLLMLIGFVGGRIVPSFTRNWLVKQDPAAETPAPFGWIDRAAIAFSLLALLFWVLAPQSTLCAVLAIIAGMAVAMRLYRWRGEKTWAEPLLAVMHLAYGWLAFGFLLLGLDHFLPVLPPSTAVHALTVGAIGTMTLAMMTRVALGHTGRPLAAGPATRIIYTLITLAALLRLFAPFAGGGYFGALVAAGAAWCGAFGCYLLFYTPVLALPRVRAEAARPV